MEQIIQIIKDNTLNIILCVLLVVVGYYLTRKYKKMADVTGSYQLRAYTPTIWTSLGILGTFVSILYSLYIFVKYKSNDINLLIYNIAPAFTTSIIGILGSIITSLNNKRYLASVEGNEGATLALLNEQISTNKDTYSPEIILLEILKEIKEGQKKSTSENADLITKLESLNTENINAIEELQLSLEGKHELLLNKVEEESNTTRESLSNALQTQKEDFEKAVTDIETKFDSTLSEQNRILENKLNTLNSTLGTKIDSYNTTSQNLITQLIDTTKEKLAEESKKRNEELQSFINDENEKITGFINEQIQLYRGINDSLSSTVADVRKLFEEDVKQAIEKFAKEQYQVSIEALTKWNSDLVADANKCLKEHSEAMRNNMDELDEKTKETYDSFHETINGIAQIVADKLQGLYDHQTRLVGDTIEDNRGQLMNALMENRQSIQTILNANEQALSKVSTEIKADNGEIKQELVNVQSEWKKEAIRIEGEHLDEVKRIHTHAEHAINGILSKITSYESTIQQSLNGIKEELIKSVQEFKEKITDIENFIVYNNKGLQSDLTQQIHDAFQIKELEVACEKLRNGIDSTISSLNKNTDGIKTSLLTINESLKGSSQKYIDTVVNSNDLLTYINETLQVNKQNITSVVAILGQIDTLNKAANQIEEDIKRIQSLQSGENDKTKRNKRQEQ